MARETLVGRIYGRLTVVERAASVNQRGRWKCVCQCGEVIEADTSHLNKGAVKSCGCLLRECRHGLARRGQKSSEYLIWVSMHQRCSNTRNKSYPRYGGRGIAVCARWSDFQMFLLDMGVRPTKKHSIERRNTDGDYEPSNCEWQTTKVQSNNKRNNIIVEVDGSAMTLMQACERLGLKYFTILSRIHRGDTPQHALDKGGA